MGKVVVDITTSVDGFIAGPNDGPELPLGEGGERLHEWVFDLASWRKPHGLAGGKSNGDSEVVDEALRTTGAVIVGRRMFDNAGGWGENPPFLERTRVIDSPAVTHLRFRVVPRTQSARATTADSQAG